MNGALQDYFVAVGCIASVQSYLRNDMLKKKKSLGVFLKPYSNMCHEKTNDFLFCHTARH